VKILVVDDSKAMRMIVKRNLTAAGYGDGNTILEAENGVQGLAVVEAESPDLVLCDWNMPEMNGLEFIVAVRKEPRYKSMTLMMVTTESEQGQIVRALAAGAHEYVIKPFTPDAIVEKLALLGLVQNGVTA
jgi:two-component system chemotaxis response regulator CheY